MKIKDYKVKIEHNLDPKAPTFEEYMQNSVKPWIEELIYAYIKEGLNKKPEVPDANHSKRV